MPDCNYCGRFINTSATGWLCGCEGERCAGRHAVRSATELVAPKPPMFTDDEAIEVCRLIKSRLSVGDYMHDLRAARSGMFQPEHTRAYNKRLAAIESVAKKADAMKG